MKTAIEQHKQLTTRNVAKNASLRVAYTPDSDDAFNYYAWEHGRIELDGWPAEFHRDHIIALNRSAMENRFDVVGVSSASYPLLAERYWVLAVGNSVGRGYGPVLASKHHRTPGELRGKRVAVAGIPTTGGALAAMYCPGAELVEMRYDRIADAVAAGEYDAGVMIHEELLFFPQKGLTRVCDLGAAWCEDTGLPLPVGLNLVHKGLGRGLARRIAGTCRRSLQWGLDHFEEAYAFASRFGRGCSQRHIEMFSNADTLCLPPDVRRAMGLMFQRVADLGLGPRIEHWEIIDA
ncbi:MAG: ABC transporter substrate-binding protein [Planctomycetes bacterium]|nr:ABC transporter substrate-binding protein [Planctomycetota bacterium]